MTLKRFIKKIILKGFELFGVNWMMRNHSSTPIVLFWHGVSNYLDLDIEGESFSANLFEKQIKYVAKHYEVVSVGEFYNRYKSKSLNNKEAVITFDDGYKDNLTVAAPILKKCNLPFTVFVSALNVQNQERFYISIPRLIIIGGELEKVEIPSMNYQKVMHSKSERIIVAHDIEYTIKYFSHKQAKQVSQELIEYIGQERFNQLCSKYTNGTLMTWDDVRELVANYDCTIGSHCLDHCICHNNQDINIIKEQLEESKRIIEKECGTPCEFFAYPNGDYSVESNNIVARTYKMGFSTREVSVYDSLIDASCIGRVGVPCDYDEFIFFVSRLQLR